ncbi:MAG: methyltransferase domain-containing protein [Ignavibacteria bacterium]|nr:methyltransferase domain-containing protein [Ignavibacteria bacterium]
MKNINSPGENDNRNYNYEGCETEARSEYSFFVDSIPPGASVVDLGCGNGSLLQLLIDKKQVKATGVELSASGVAACIKKGITAIEGRIDEKLPFTDKQFDYAICNVTIQMVMYPDILLREMKRIARHLIISFPNFAFYKNRLDMFLKGRMPRPCMFGYSWYNTGHLHQLSIRDFEELVAATGGLQITRCLYPSPLTGIKRAIQDINPNLLHIMCVCILDAIE